MDVSAALHSPPVSLLSLATPPDDALALADRVLAAVPLQRASAPLRHERRRRASGWRRTGLIVGRTWDSGFDEREYRLLLVGGSARRLARPDGVTRAGQPVYLLTDAERRAAERLLNRLCQGGVEQIVRRHNVACNDGRGALLNTICNVSGYSGIQWFAVGTGTSANGPQSSDHQLFSEYFRKQPTSYTVSGNQSLIATFFQANEAVTTYTEAGIFGSAPAGYSGGSGSAGATASATPNSGLLFAHVNYPYTKAQSVTLTNDYYVSEN